MSHIHLTAPEKKSDLKILKDKNDARNASKNLPMSKDICTVLVYSSKTFSLISPNHTSSFLST